MFSKLAERIKYFFFEIENDWEIGVCTSPIESFLKNKELPKIKWFSMPRNVFWADPFGIWKDNKYYIFYEEYNKQKGYATINCMVLNSELEELEQKIIIDEGFHCSFPLVFFYSGEYYMLPETCVIEKAILYKAINFPFEWKQEATLLNIACVDSILYFKDNYWWLIYTKSQATNGNSTIYVRRNIDLTHGWEKCKELTIIGNLYNSRSGGTIFESENEIYRVTQNCTNSYGQSVVINKITSLSAEDFKEIAVKEVTMLSFGISGFHTLSSCGGYTLVDRRRERLFLKTSKKILETIQNKIFLKSILRP